MSLSTADEKVIKRIKDCEYKAYPEQRYVDPAIVPGGFVTFLSFIFLMISFIFPGNHPVPTEYSLLGTLVGICLLIPGIIVWLYFRQTYSFVGLRRFQVSLSITALELANHGIDNVKPIISPKCPEEFQYLPLFVALGPGTLLSRLQGLDWAPETLARMKRQSEKYTASITAFAGALALLGGLITLPLFVLLSLFSASGGPFFPLLGLFLLLLGVGILLNSRRKLRNLEKQESELTDSNAPHIASQLSSERSVKDVLALIKLGYAHPIRVLVLDTYSDLEYTGRTYLTGDELEIREALLQPRADTQWRS